MPAIGLLSGNKYSDRDILNKDKYIEMTGEPLCAPGDEDRLVIPVRREGAPHFRDLTKNRNGARIGRSEDDPAHEKCIAWILKSLFDPSSSKKRNLKVATNVFDKDNSRSQQVIFTTPAKSNYFWWREGRITFDDGRYIQSDICGRDTTTFAAGANNRSIIIEVIQQHYPEEETFFKLLQLSAQNHIVVFYFIAPGKVSSTYSRYDLTDTELTLIPRYYLLNGEFFKNDVPLIGDKTRDSSLYRELQVKHFDPAMVEKKA